MVDVFKGLKGKIRGSLRGASKNLSTSALNVHSGGESVLLQNALEHGIYGIALWDEEFNLIRANRQYADLHKIPSTLLTPGRNLLAIMQNLKSRGILTADTDPTKLKEHISHTLASIGHLTSVIKFSDGTFLEISAERLSNGCIVAYLRNATREKILSKAARENEKKTEKYADAITCFPIPSNQDGPSTFAEHTNQITKTVATLLSVDWCIVWTRSEILNEAAAVSAYQHATQSHIHIDTMVLPDLGSYLAALETSQIIAIDDLDNHAYGRIHGNRAPLDDYAHASIDIPFRKNNLIMGVLSCLDTKSARRWTAADKMFVMSAASRIGELMNPQREDQMWELPTSEINGSSQAAE